MSWNYVFRVMYLVLLALESSLGVNPAAHQGLRGHNGYLNWLN